MADLATHWDPLLDLDQGASDELHEFALHHDAFVAVLKVISTVRSAVVYTPLFTALTLWLLVRGLHRLAAFVAVTVTVSAIVNALTARLLARPAGACPRRGAATGDPPVQAEEGLEPEAAPRLS